MDRMSRRFRSPIAGAALSALVLGVPPALAAPQQMPQLALPAPEGWVRSVMSPEGGAGYVSPGPPARLDVYPFRPFTGGLEPRFSSSLLRELVAEGHREAGLRGAPTVEDFPVKGADAARSAIFVEDRGGSLRYRVRIAVLAKGAVALVDIIADTPETLDSNRGWPPVLRSLQSMSVVSPAPPQASPPSGAAAGPAGTSQGRAGLYLAQVNRMYLRPNFSGGGGMTTDHKVDTEFYLLSADGRVYRGYGLPEVPGGDLRNFDFEAARRKDPGNVGTYAAQGDQVTIRIGGAAGRDETIAATVVEGDALRFRNSTYKRARLKGQ